MPISFQEVLYFVAEIILILFFQHHRCRPVTVTWARDFAKIPKTFIMTILLVAHKELMLLHAAAGVGNSEYYLLQYINRAHNSF